MQSPSSSTYAVQRRALSETIAGDAVLIIPDATLYHVGNLTSRMHNAWMRTVAGRLEMRYRYSNDIVYNNFIWPS